MFIFELVSTQLSVESIELSNLHQVFQVGWQPKIIDDLLMWASPGLTQKLLFVKMVFQHAPTINLSINKIIRQPCGKK